METTCEICKWNDKHCLDTPCDSCDEHNQWMPIVPILKYFNFEHLPERLQKISEPLCDVAHIMDLELPDCPEKMMGFRKLLEAKDCFVRAALED